LNLEQIKEKDKKYYMNTFGDRLPVVFESGNGLTLTASDGTVYNDFLGGIAVNALGHRHPKFTAAMHSQLDKMLHISNYYYNEPQTMLAEKIVNHTCADKVFLANSGAEANEGAIKLAKIYFYKQKKNKFEIISLDKSFHGRTLATVAATGQEKYQAPYRPLTPGFIQVKPNDFEAVLSAVNENTAAVMIELIQGESGVHPMDIEYVKKLRQLCDEKDILLIFDEVQTGMGRTGYWFAHQMYGVEPDIFTAAKALGGGVPIGAVCAKDFVANSFSPGDHGSTFGGNPFASAAGNAVFDIIEDEKLLENTQKMSTYFMEKLNVLKLKYSEIKDLRNAGLLIGIEFEDETAKKVYNKMFEKKYLTSLCKNTIRLAPALIIAQSDIDGFINALSNTLNEL
jgi:acetylornithine/N-succinyldiaminopimelate aminotransferase